MVRYVRMIPRPVELIWPYIAVCPILMSHSDNILLVDYHKRFTRLPDMLAGWENSRGLTGCSIGCDLVRLMGETGSCDLSLHLPGTNVTVIQNHPICVPAKPGALIRVASQKWSASPRAKHRLRTQAATWADFPGACPESIEWNKYPRLWVIWNSKHLFSPVAQPENILFARFLLLSCIGPPQISVR